MGGRVPQHPQRPVEQRARFRAGLVAHGRHPGVDTADDLGSAGPRDGEYGLGVRQDGPYLGGGQQEVSEPAGEAGRGPGPQAITEGDGRIALARRGAEL